MQHQQTWITSYKPQEYNAMQSILYSSINIAKNHFLQYINLIWASMKIDPAGL